MDALRLNRARCRCAFQKGSQKVRRSGYPAMVMALVRAEEMGDVYLEISFAPHPIYRVEGKDILMDLPVSPWEAALGGKVILPTAEGKVDLTILQNARAGQTLRLKGKGLPAGNLLASLVIVNPDLATEEARSLFE